VKISKARRQEATLYTILRLAYNCYGWTGCFEFCLNIFLSKEMKRPVLSPVWNNVISIYQQSADKGVIGNGLTGCAIGFGRPT